MAKYWICSKEWRIWSYIPNSPSDTDKFQWQLTNLNADFFFFIDKKLNVNDNLTKLNLRFEGSKLLRTKLNWKLMKLNAEVTKIGGKTYIINYAMLDWQCWICNVHHSFHHFILHNWQWFIIHIVQLDNVTYSGDSYSQSQRISHESHELYFIIDPRKNCHVLWSTYTSSYPETLISVKMHKTSYVCFR